MNMALIILLGELFLVMVFFLIGFGIAAWRRKKSLNTALDQLVKDIERRRPERREKLLNRLQNDYGFDDAKATETSDELLQIENAFLKKFFAIQFTQDGSAIGTLGGTLHKLLDRYFDLVPSANVATNLDKTQTVESEIQSEEANSAVNSSPKSEPGIAFADTETENPEPVSAEDQAEEPEAANQPEKEVSVNSGDDTGSAPEESSAGVSGLTDAAIKQEADLEKADPGDESSEIADGNESNSNSLSEEVAAIEASDEMEIQSEAEPNWDEAFAEIEMQEPATEVDTSKQDEAVAAID